MFGPLGLILELGAGPGSNPGYDESAPFGAPEGNPMKTTCSFLLCAGVFAASAHAQFFEGRSSAMGNTGVASARYVVAPLTNPALMSRFGDSDTFGMIIPTVGVSVQDKDGLLQDIDDFQDAFDALAESLDNGSASVTERQDVANLLTRMNGKRVTGNVGANFTFVLPMEEFSVGLFARSYLDAAAAPEIAASDIALINNPATATGDQLRNGLQSQARAISAGLSEVGVSFSTAFAIGENKLAVGLTPKFQRVDTFNYAININNFDEDDVDDSQFRNDDTGVNLDVGAALMLQGGFTFGVMIRNVISDEYQTPLAGLFNTSFEYNIEPVATIGAAWNNETFALTAEVDVLETERFTDVSGLVDDNSRFVRAGAEIDLADWVQLRGGVQFDTEDTVTDLITAGIGLSPGDLVHLDIAGQLGEEDTYGAVVQLSITF